MYLASDTGKPPCHVFSYWYSCPGLNEQWAKAMATLKRGHICCLVLFISTFQIFQHQKHNSVPSVLSHCGFGDRKCIQPVKISHSNTQRFLFGRPFGHPVWCELMCSLFVCFVLLVFYSTFSTNRLYHVIDVWNIYIYCVGPGKNT